jgi:hypothetical protein
MRRKNELNVSKDLPMHRVEKLLFWAKNYTFSTIHQAIHLNPYPPDAIP